MLLLRRFLAFFVALLVMCHPAAAEAQTGPTDLTLGSRYSTYRTFADAVCDDLFAASCVIQADQARYPEGFSDNGRTHRELAIYACTHDFNARWPRLLRQERERTLVDLVAESPFRASAQQRSSCLAALQRPNFEEQLAGMDRSFQQAVARRREQMEANRLAQQPAVKDPPNQGLSPAESADLVNQLDAEARTNNPDVLLAQLDSPRPVPLQGSSHGSSRGSSYVHASADYLGLKGFELIALNGREAVLRILPGASFYTLERSFLAKDFEVDSIAVMTYKGNDRAQIFFPFIIRDHKIELYQPRLRLKANDLAGRLGSIDAATLAFMRQCGTGSCEARFALQAGEIIRLPRRGMSSGTATKPPVSRPAPVIAAPTTAPAPLPSVSVLPSVPTVAPQEPTAAVTASAVPEEQPAPVPSERIGTTETMAPVSSAPPIEVFVTGSARPQATAQVSSVPSAAASSPSAEAGTPPPKKATGSRPLSSTWKETAADITLILLVALLAFFVFKAVSLWWRRRKDRLHAPDDPSLTGVGGTDPPPAPSTPPPAADSTPPPSSPRSAKPSKLGLWWRTAKAWTSLKLDEAKSAKASSPAAGVNSSNDPPPPVVADADSGGQPAPGSKGAAFDLEFDDDEDDLDDPGPQVNVPPKAHDGMGPKAKVIVSQDGAKPTDPTMLI